MTTLKIEIKKTQIEAYKKACVAKGIRIESLNLIDCGEHWVTTNYKPTNERERDLLRSVHLW